MEFFEKNYYNVDSYYFFKFIVGGLCRSTTRKQKNPPSVFGEKFNEPISNEHLKDFEAINKNTYSKI